MRQPHFYEKSYGDAAFWVDPQTEEGKNLLIINNVTSRFVCGISDEEVKRKRGKLKLLN
jgi:hypothetical protein